MPFFQANLIGVQFLIEQNLVLVLTSLRLLGTSSNLLCLGVLYPFKVVPVRFT